MGSENTSFKPHELIKPIPRKLSGSNNYSSSSHLSYTEFNSPISGGHGISGFNLNQLALSLFPTLKYIQSLNLSELYAKDLETVKLINESFQNENKRETPIIEKLRSTKIYDKFTIDDIPTIELSDISMESESEHEFSELETVNKKAQIEPKKCVNRNPKTTAFRTDNCDDKGLLIDYKNYVPFEPSKNVKLYSPPEKVE